jgi:hypothetical protein
MSLYLIKGQYRIVHSEPDGDSVHFLPDDPQAFTSCWTCRASPM